MMYDLIFKEEAFEDIKKAFDYYSSIRIELGSKFMNALEEYITEISKYPLHFQIKRTPFREAVVRNFPYCYFL